MSLFPADLEHTLLHLGTYILVCTIVVKVNILIQDGLEYSRLESDDSLGVRHGAVIRGVKGHLLPIFI